MHGVIFVGLGGALGSVLRYCISLIPYKGGFPILTLITNLLGAVLIGWIAAAAQKSGLSQNVVLFLKTGLCGGFTTFSTFSLEAAALLQRGSFASAAVYVLLSLFGCIGGVYLGGLAAK